MATTTVTARGATFRVLDALAAPYGGRILRLRLQEGEAPAVRSLKGARLRATGPEGREVSLLVKGFPVFGGKPSDERVARTGRLDLHVDELDGDGPVDLRWEVRVG